MKSRKVPDCSSSWVSRGQWLRWTVLAALLGLWSLSAFASRVKDLAVLKGQRTNQLMGYGLVIGLSGTGDKGMELTGSSLAQVLKGFGLDQKPERLETKNAAAVLVTAQLPPFSRAGSQVDVSVSSIGSATSLEGGTLLLTSLRGSDGKVYGMAQGKIFITKREGGTSGKALPVSLVTAEVPRGATIERELATDWSSLRELRYQLHSPDFTTAARIAHRINQELAGKYATALDAGTVDVILPYGFEGTAVDLVARIEEVEVEADTRAKVVVNSRSGTVILGDKVRILPVAIAHGNLRVEVKDSRAVSALPAQPGDVSAAPPPSPVGEKKGKPVMALNGATSISEVIAGLNDLGAGPDDLVSVLRSLKQSGALLADLEIQ